ncbi:Transmembrane protein [Thalictrum thalictroides]|uniref:Transmembrane protein n=1 Tax=Thalictrum thalictroides TaxID=46969 RepID=A0A7J6WV76_THATH|nr:Transmembrane protein [Thalictrum thalictroides]
MEASVLVLKDSLTRESGSKIHHGNNIQASKNFDDSTDRLSQLDASRDEHIHGPSHQTYSAARSQEDSLVQVMKAVEAAENTIKQQVEENNRLRAELQKRTLEFERHNSDDSNDRLSQLDASRDELIHGPSHHTYSAAGSQEDRFRWKDDTPLVDRRGTLVVHQNVTHKNVDPSIHNREESQHYSENNNVNGPLKVYPGGQAGVDNTGVSQLSSPSSRSISRSRYQREGDYDLRNISAHGLMPISEDLLLKVREQEEEILQLRKHLADYSVKEAQICNEKYVLEKRIAYMRMAFDQQQQELVDAASKSLSYRQDIIEENIRLTYALQGGIVVWLLESKSPSAHQL